MNTFNDRFLKACRREETDRPPIWMMRQAGRYQKGYRAIREKYSIVDICKIPEVCTEVTLLPIEQFGFDAAIVFSDIMIPLEPMGISFEYKPGVGPIIHNPIRSKSDVEALTDLDLGSDLQYTATALSNLKSTLNVPCLGFVGAPFTLASYMIEGGPSKSHILLKTFMYAETEAWHTLMKRLAYNMADYLLLQVESGAAAVQIFDSWIGILSQEDYQEYVYPHMFEMVQYLKGKTNVPIVLFGTNTAHLLQDFKRTGADVVGIDWKTDLPKAWSELNYEVAVQGNLDPTSLFAPWEVIEKKAKSLLASIPSKPGYIFNLGHGILPKTPEEHVRQLVQLVQKG
ncbi:MAG: uroporphyrinogen decarboxylase [Verrucomicrobia bacterium]|nr:uroporphyrinogen decarboxylase [Verrucomicrobiota bacterium]|tara:strand:- start:673 stop:1698 length:1026 start_codon:yes stop_codon:yes gene_type:complete